VATAAYLFLPNLLALCLQLARAAGTHAPAAGPASMTCSKHHVQHEPARATAQLNDVDTVKGVANVKLGVVMYWTDTRLIGWTSKLPSNLWGPYYDSAAGGSALRSV
jgi:hypothetical protein